MTRNFHIIIPKTLRMNLAEFLTKVFKDYDGKLFIPEETEFSSTGEGFKDLIPSNNFAALKIRPDLESVRINGGRNPSFRIYDVKSGGFPTISFSSNYIVRDTEEEIRIFKRDFQDILGFSKLLMKQAEAEYFYGGFESWGDAADPSNEDIGFIYCKGDLYIEKIQQYIKNHLNLSFTREEVKKNGEISWANRRG